MQRQLIRRVIVSIEDEPLVALDVRQAFEDAGEKTISAVMTPEVLHRARRAFHQLWAVVAVHYTGGPEVARARTRLATLVFCLTADGSRDLEQVKADVVEFFAPAPIAAHLLH